MGDMKSTIELGAVFQCNWDERPIRVIAFDDKVVHVRCLVVTHKFLGHGVDSP
jgi:hypothetical protein